jgi:predicted ABC-type ATPase
LLHGALAVTEFVNADVIARGLSAFDPDRVAIAAGRVMLARLRELANRRESFAFETTLASRSFAPWLRTVAETGYDVHLLFLWLPSADFAVARVADRVRAGGHSVPDNVIRRRYRAGLDNFLTLYERLVSTWRLYDSSAAEPRLVGRRLESQPVQIYDEAVWSAIQTQGVA